MDRDRNLFLDLPQAPQIQRALILSPAQRIGILLLMVIPILAIIGVFGESFTQFTQSSQDLTMTVAYATRYRYKMINDLKVFITNDTDQPIPTLRVSFSRDYIDQFSTVTFTPSIDHISATDYVVELSDLQPGESRGIRLELQGESYGQHQGVISANADGLEPVEAEVTTFIFP